MALSGPTLAPARGPATHLVVLVHGYGADGQDLLGLANHWQGLLPTVAFAAPNAPTRVPGSAGYQWFPISRIDPHEMQKGVEVAGPQLDEYLDGELARLGLPSGRDGMEAWLASRASRQQASWKELLTLAADARSLNETNGKLINLHLQHNQQALNVLLAAVDKAVTYGPDGQQKSASGGRSLGSA